MPALLAPGRPTHPRREADAGCGGRPTLEEMLDGAWEQLRSGLSVTCPLCGGRMEPEPGGAGRCRDCRTALS